MRKVLNVLRRSLSSITLLLTAVAIGLCIYVIVQDQNEREQTIVSNCQSQNLKHTNTVNELESQVKKFSKGQSPARREQLAASQQFTILPIDRLAPYQNCQKVLAKSTSTH